MNKITIGEAAVTASSVPVRPVFVFGCQRSGTTMLAAQLGRGRNVVALPEMQFVKDLLADARLAKPAGIADAYGRLMRNFRFRAIGLPFSLAEFEAAAAAGGAREILLAMVRKYVAHHGLDKCGDEIVWVEHSPNHRNDVDLLLAHFPEARFVHIVRDPRGVYASMKSNPRFFVWEPMTFVRRWVFAVAAGHLSAIRHPGRCLEVRYEDILADPEAELRRISAFAGVAFDPRMLEGGGVILPSFTRAQHALTGTRPDASRAEGWRSRISAREAETIRHYCGQWMRAYGYLDRIEPSREPAVRDKAGWVAKSFVMYAYSRFYIAVHNKIG